MAYFTKDTPGINNDLGAHRDEPQQPADAEPVIEIVPLEDMSKAALLELAAAAKLDVKKSDSKDSLIAAIRADQENKTQGE